MTEMEELVDEGLAEYDAYLELIARGYRMRPVRSLVWHKTIQPNGRQYFYGCLEGKHVLRSVFSHLHASGAWDRGMRTLPEGYKIWHLDNNALNDIPRNLVCATTKEWRLSHVIPQWCKSIPIYVRGVDSYNLFSFPSIVAGAKELDIERTMLGDHLRGTSRLVRSRDGSRYVAMYTKDIGPNIEESFYNRLQAALGVRISFKKVPAYLEDNSILEKIYEDKSARFLENELAEEFRI